MLRPALSLIRSQSLIQTPYPNIHYQTVSLLLAIVACGRFVHGFAVQFLTHATPMTISNGTPVFSLMAFARKGRGAPRPSSTRAYNAWVTPSTRAASR